MKKNRIKNIIPKLVLTLALLFGAAVMAKADVIRLTVKEDLATCTGVAPTTCMQVKYKNSKNWELFYGGIDGFDYKPGYRYVLLVNRTKRKNVPADASAYIYTLKKVVKKQRIKQSGNNWDFVLQQKWKLIQMNGVAQNQSPVYITFDANSKRVSGKSGCNSFFGGFERNSNNLSFKKMGSTLMACSDELNKLEHQFLTLLGDQTFTFDVADQTLNFYQNNKLVLQFGKAPLNKQQ